MKIRDNKGSITIFVLIGLLFMSAFLLISYANNINKSKVAKEQLNIISSIYSYGDGDAKSYERAYTAIRKRNAQTLTEIVEDSYSVELNKTFDDKISNYKIYGNSQQGKNVLIYPYYNSSSTRNGITYDVQADGSIICNGTAVATSKFTLMSDIELQNYVGYTISGGYETGSASTFWIGLNQNGEGDKGEGFTITQSNADRHATDSIVVRIASGYTCDNLVIKPQLEKGKKTEWASQVPTPDTPIETESVGDYDETTGKYKIPVKVSGKNLFDIDSAVNSALIKNSDGTYEIWKNSSERFSNTVSVNIQANTTFTASYELLEYNGTYWAPLQWVVFFDDGTNTTLGVDSVYKSVTVSYQKDIVSMQLYQENSMPIGTYTKLKNIQVEINDTATEYEPYIEPITTNIYLDEPLRKIGNYADYIDFEAGKVVRNVRSITLNISDMNNIEDYPGWNNVEHIKEDYPTKNEYLNNLTSVFCNISNKMYAIGINTNNYNSILWLEYGVFNLTQTQWKETYSDLKVNICHGLATEDPQPIELPEISTFEDYTRIEVLTQIQPSKIEVEYLGYTIE